ncbi:uncharacterized protein LOC144002756 [Festucalex cinctus]
MVYTLPPILLLALNIRTGRTDVVTPPSVEGRLDADDVIDRTMKEGGLTLAGLFLPVVCNVAPLGVTPVNFPVAVAGREVKKISIGVDGDVICKETTDPDPVSLHSGQQTSASLETDLHSCAGLPTVLLSSR